MAEPVESSRIFVRNLPPSIKEADFQKHFAKAGPVTDIKLIAHRRIGYVGYKTPETARHAAKYFNKSFVRMSKIAVELARSVKEMGPKSDQGGAAVRADASDDLEVRGEKRKRAHNDYTREQKPDNAKLNEFLEVMQPNSRKIWSNEDDTVLRSADRQNLDPTIGLVTSESEGEYEDVPKRQKTKDSRSKEAAEAAERVQRSSALASSGVEVVDPTDIHHNDQTPPETTEQSANNPGRVLQPSLQDDVYAKQSAKSDVDWLRSRTSRLLGLEDEASNNEDSDDDEDSRERQHVKGKAPRQIDAPAPTDSPLVADVVSDASSQTDEDLHEHPSVKPEESDLSNGIDSRRLFVRNLSYDTTEEDLRKHFRQFGALEEVHLPKSGRQLSSKGFAYIHFEESEAATQALAAADGKPFQGRLLHIIAAAPKRDNVLDEYALSKLPHKKQQQLRRKAEAASSTFQWNTLFMNPDAVLASTADRFGVSKSEILDPTSSSAGIKQAHAETNILRETKKFFESNGIMLDSFRSKSYSDTVILIKNFSFGTSTDELRRLCDVHGTVKRLLMPPAGTMAIVEFEQSQEAKKAFAALSYRKLGDTILFLEKAPKDVFAGKRQAISGEENAPENRTLSTTDLLDPTVPDQPSSTLFVRNLNFDTPTATLHDLFLPLKGFLSARVKTKRDPKKPGQILSMGFGFVEFRSKEDAQAALNALNGYALDGHKLQIRASHKAVDAAEEQRREDNAKKAGGRYTKIIIKNLPFEATKREVRELFSPYGKLRSVRVPKKFDSSTRGFAFGDFVTPKEARNAMDALAGVHLLGRRLNLEFAAADAVNPEEEIEKMSRKVSKQADYVATQELAKSGQRKKFNVHQDDDDLDA